MKWLILGAKFIRNVVELEMTTVSVWLSHLIVLLERLAIWLYSWKGYCHLSFITVLIRFMARLLLELEMQAIL